jgi:hypothetical protein
VTFAAAAADGERPAYSSRISISLSEVGIEDGIDDQVETAEVHADDGTNGAARWL